MVDDESEPSFFRYLENNLPSGSSSTTSESAASISCGDEHEEQSKSTNLERKTSISLYNVSSTPHAFKPLKKCRFRTGSQYDIDSDHEYKPKRKKYDHIESKVKQYRNEIRQQTEYRRALRQQQEDELKTELENNLRISDYEHKNHSSKFLPNDISNEDFESNLMYLSPIVNSNEEKDTVFFELIELKDKYNQALNEIETLKVEMMKLRATKSTTPRLSRRKCSQSSMIKTCLFKNSSMGNRQNTLQNNTTRSTLFGGDSTCCTMDVEDLMSPNSITFTKKRNCDNGPPENNPFIVRSSCASPIANSITNSSAPLLFDFETRPRRNSVYKFFNNFIKCPTMGFLHKLKPDRTNKVAPIIPCVMISSPSSAKSVAESYEFVGKQYYDDESLLDSAKQELLLKEMTDCCEELTEKFARFKKLFEHKHNNNFN